MLNITAEEFEAMVLRHVFELVDPSAVVDSELVASVVSDYLAQPEPLQNFQDAVAALFERQVDMILWDRLNIRVRKS